MRKKKPAFDRQDAHKKKRLGTKWRKPKGLHSKMRLQKRGYNKRISKGYRAPAVVRGLHSSGLVAVTVSTLKELDGVKKNQGVMLTKIGQKKKLVLLKKAIEKNIVVLNYKDPKKTIENIENEIKERKQKVKKEEKTEEKTIEKKLEESDVDKKTKEKKELDKILTKA